MMEVRYQEMVEVQLVELNLVILEHLEILQQQVYAQKYVEMER